MLKLAYGIGEAPRLHHHDGISLLSAALHTCTLSNAKQTLSCCICTILAMAEQLTNLPSYHRMFDYCTICVTPPQLEIKSEQSKSCHAWWSPVWFGRLWLQQGQLMVVLSVSPPTIDKWTLLFVASTFNTDKWPYMKQKQQATSKCKISTNSKIINNIKI